MPDLNKVMIMGNLTRDPEIKRTPKGMAVADLGIAVNETYKAQDGTVKETVLYVDVEVWGRQAETSVDYLRKGSPVFIEGRLRLDQWENAQGEKKKMLRVRADRVQFLRSGSGGQGGSGGGGGSGRSSGGGGQYEDRPMSNVRETPAARPTRPAPSPADDVPPMPDDDDIPF